MDSPHILSLLHQVLLSQKSLNDSLGSEISLFNASLSPWESTPAPSTSFIHHHYSNTTISPWISTTNTIISPPPFHHFSQYSAPDTFTPQSSTSPPFYYHPPPTTTNLNLHYHHDQPLPSSPLLPLSVAPTPLYVSISTMDGAVTKKLQDVTKKPTGVETESVAKTDLMTQDVASPELVNKTQLAPAIARGQEMEQALITERGKSSINERFTDATLRALPTTLSKPQGNVTISPPLLLLPPPLPLKPPDREVFTHPDLSSLTPPPFLLQSRRMSPPRPPDFTYDSGVYTMPPPKVKPPDSCCYKRKNVPLLLAPLSRKLASFFPPPPPPKPPDCPLHSMISPPPTVSSHSHGFLQQSLPCALKAGFLIYPTQCVPFDSKFLFKAKSKPSTTSTICVLSQEAINVRHVYDHTKFVGICCIMVRAKSFIAAVGEILDQSVLPLVLKAIVYTFVEKKVGSCDAYNKTIKSLAEYPLITQIVWPKHHHSMGNAQHKRAYLSFQNLHVFTKLACLSKFSTKSACLSKFGWLTTFVTWDPGENSISTIASSLHFKKWDPGKFLIISIFLQL